jgi:3-deoxy-D-manno-octulosonate 8-phosphate phosphatase (KDO 8-P phosphatase)
MQFNISQLEARELASQIRLLLLDVDGVLTDGKLYYSNSGEEMKAFCTLDGHGIKMLIENDIQVGIITGRNSELLARRARELGIHLLYQGQSNKVDALRDALDRTGCSPEQVAFIGDDFPDLPVMRIVGLGVAVGSGHPDLATRAELITERGGGNGAVRETADFILNAQDKFLAYLD